MRRIEQGAVYSCATRTRTQTDALIADLTKGSAALIFDAQRKAVTFEARTANVRAVSEPTIEKSVSGAKDAFVETLRINTSLVRRRLHTPALKLRRRSSGGSRRPPSRWYISTASQTPRVCSASLTGSTRSTSRRCSAAATLSRI